jgi:hypothetical protein
VSTSADQEKHAIAIAIPELKKLATSVADEMKSAATPVEGPLRARFIQVRSALFQRGIYDPVLVRFDSDRATGDRGGGGGAVVGGGRSAVAREAASGVGLRGLLACGTQLRRRHIPDA